MAFEGRVALVTGGGSGMGQRMCERLAASGVKVAAVDVDEEGLARTGATSDLISVYTCDVTDVDAVQRLVEKVEGELGAIDRTVSAAAVMPSGLLLEQDIASIHRVMDIDYKGVVNVVMSTLPQMVERGRGDQVIFASLMGHMPTMYLGAYSAAKHAVKAFAEVLYHENVDSGVRFVCVSPPAVKTPLLKQLGGEVKSIHERPASLTPDDVLDAVEQHLDRGRFHLLMNEAKAGALAYRLIPKQVWKNIHRIEGR